MAEEYGISKTVQGIVIETMNTTENPLAEPIPDQQNHVTDEKHYSTRIDLKLTYRGTKLTVNGNKVSFDSKDWFVDSHEDAGSYNGLKRYNLSAHRFEKAGSSNQQQPTAS